MQACDRHITDSAATYDSPESLAGWGVETLQAAWVSTTSVRESVKTEVGEGQQQLQLFRQWSLVIGHSWKRTNQGPGTKDQGPRTSPPPQWLNIQGRPPVLTVFLGFDGSRSPDCFTNRGSPEPDRRIPPNPVDKIVGGENTRTARP